MIAYRIQVELCSSSVRFLESSSGTWTTELLWLASSGVLNEKSLIVLNKQVFNLSFGLLILVLLIVRNDSLGNCHSDSHDLGHGTTAFNSNSDAKILESVSSNDEDWLVDLHSHGLWLDQLEWLSVDSDNTLSSFSSISSSIDTLDESNSGCVLLSTESSHLLLFFTHTCYL